MVSRSFVAPSLGAAFLVLSVVFASAYVTGESGTFTILAAALIGAYMALNIGANDVANNVGPAVGAKAITMGGAIAIAIVFESAGAMIAGGNVVSTISKGIIDPASVADASIFIRVMLAALVSAALWINLATWLGAPVSTTHSVVGGVMGAGIAAAGLSAVNWPTMGSIAASWVISPVIGGVIAAAFLAFIKAMIIYQNDKIAAARRWVPLLIAIMTGAFTAYLAIKGLKKLISVDIQFALTIGSFFGILTLIITRPLIRHQSEGMENRSHSLRKLFRIPLICSAALLSFAHGANDVANAVGPLAAIVHAAQNGGVTAKVAIPMWVMVIGALGISFGLLLYGPKLIRVVGQQITKLNPMRAFCVALGAAITVIVASWLGLPVSSTHITLGGVFGVGFFREWYIRNSKRRREYIRAKGGIQRTQGGAEYEQQIARKLVRRTHFMTIIAAWLITVPAASLLSALIYFLLDYGFA